MVVEVHNSVGALFMMAFQTFTSSFYSVLLTFQLEKPVFLREHSAQFYSLPVYYITKNIFELPLVTFAPIV